MKTALLSIYLLLVSSLDGHSSITLQSSDGRKAEFTGILKLNQDGRFAAREGSVRPMLIPWEQLDIEHAVRSLNGCERVIVNMRAGDGSELSPRGIYAENNSSSYPESVVYRVLHSSDLVAYPNFDLSYWDSSVPCKN